MNEFDIWNTVECPIPDPLEREDDPSSPLAKDGSAGTPPDFRDTRRSSDMILDGMTSRARAMFERGTELQVQAVELAGEVRVIRERLEAAYLAAEEQPLSRADVEELVKKSVARAQVVTEEQSIEITEHTREKLLGDERTVTEWKADPVCGPRVQQLFSTNVGFGRRLAALARNLGLYGRQERRGGRLVPVFDRALVLHAIEMAQKGVEMNEWNGRLGEVT